MEIKYVMFNGMFPIIFGGYFKHKDIADVFDKNPTSAGFMTMKADPFGNRIKVEVYGESISLKRRPSEEDIPILSRVVNS